MLIWLVQIADSGDIVQVTCFADQSDKFDALCEDSEGTKLQFVNAQVLPTADIRIQRSTGVDSLADPAQFTVRLVGLGVFKTLPAPQFQAITEAVLITSLRVPDHYAARFRCVRCGRIVIEGLCPRQCYKNTGEEQDADLQLNLRATLISTDDQDQLEGYLSFSAIRTMFKITAFPILEDRTKRGNHSFCGKITAHYPTCGWYKTHEDSS